MTFLSPQQQEFIQKLSEQLVAIIKEEGIEAFKKRILLALQQSLKDDEEAIGCDNTSR